MMQDEFNSIKVNNEKQTVKAEFGKVQKTEFSENGDMYLHGTSYNANLNQTVKNANVETLTEATSTVSATSGGVVTTVAGGATASTLAAGSVSAIVVASSVTITALSVVTGVSIAMHDYKCQIDLFISSNQVSYELTINDLKNEDEDYEFDYESYENEPFSIRVYNNNYDKTEPLYYGYNDGYFDNLTLGQTYNIVVTADSVSGTKTLYKDTFTTTAVASLLDFYVDSAFDYYNQIIYVYLDFVDEIDQLSDFALTITRVEDFSDLEPIEPIGDLIAEEIDVEPRIDSFSATYPLEKKTGVQEVHLDTGDMWIEPDFNYQFEFSYIRNGEKIVYQDGDISFYSAFEGNSEVYSVNFNNEANYLDQTFVLNLVYIDENDVLFDFVLHLSRDDGFTASIPLEKTTNQQIIYAEDYELDLTQTYNAYLTYTKNGVEESLELQQFSFTDNSGAISRFNDFIFPKTADFLEKTFEVRLDYKDDFKIFHQFVLTINDDFGDFNFEFELDETTELQSVYAPEIDYETEVEYNYSLTCMKEGVLTELDSGRFNFKDKYNRKSQFNSLTINEEGNFLTNVFTVQLDYVDDFNAFDFFSLNFTSASAATTSGSFDFALESKTTVQTLDAGENGMSLMDGPYNYTLYVDRYGVTEILTTGSVTFTDSSGAVSQFNELLFNGKMNGEDGSFSLTLSYQDDFDFFSGFSVRFYNDDIEFDTSISLDKTTETQYFNAYDLDFVLDETYTYVLSYYSQGSLITLEPVTFVFADVYGRTTEFNEFIFDKTGNFLTNEFKVTLDFSDSFGQYSDFILTFRNIDGSDTYSIPLQKNTFEQTINGNEYGMELRNKSYTYELTVSYQGMTITLDEGNAVFTDNSGSSSQFNEFIFDGTANKLTNVLAMQLDFVDDYGIYSDFKVTFHDVELDYDIEINLEKTTNEQTFSVDDNNMFFDNAYTYTLTCICDGVSTTLDSGNFTLTDNSGAVSEVNTPTISSSANFRTRTFQVTLNFQDDFGYFDDFVMTVRDVTTNNETIVNLNKTTEPQNVSFNDQRYNEDTGEYEYDIDIVNHTVIYTLTYYDSSVDLTNNVVEDEPLPAFTNSLTTQFNGIVSNWQLVEDPNYAGHYYVPMKLDYVDEKGIYGYLEINMYIGDDQVGMIEFQNEVVPPEGDWIAGSVSSSLSVDDLTGNAITFKVEGQIMDEKNINVTSDERATVYSTTHTLTMADNPEVLALTTDGYVSAGEVYFQTSFSGQVAEFTNTEIIIVTNDSVYTYPVTLTGIGDSLTITLNNSSEGYMDDEVLMAALSEPVTIKFSYCTVTKTGEEPGTEVISDPIEMVCYTNFLFTFSV